MQHLLRLCAGLLLLFACFDTPTQTSSLLVNSPVDDDGHFAEPEDEVQPRQRAMLGSATLAGYASKAQAAIALLLHQPDIARVVVVVIQAGSFSCHIILFPLFLSTSLLAGSANPVRSIPSRKTFPALLNPFLYIVWVTAHAYLKFLGRQSWSRNCYCFQPSTSVFLCHFGIDLFRLLGAFSSCIGAVIGERLS